MTCTIETAAAAAGSRVTNVCDRLGTFAAACTRKHLNKSHGDAKTTKPLQVPAL
jgi:hypothetical protein